MSNKIIRWCFGVIITALVTGLVSFSHAQATKTATSPKPPRATHAPQAELRQLRQQVARQQQRLHDMTIMAVTAKRELQKSRL